LNVERDYAMKTRRTVGGGGPACVVEGTSSEGVENVKG